jgi:hypothetical protein
MTARACASGIIKTSIKIAAMALKHPMLKVYLAAHEADLRRESL